MKRKKGEWAICRKTTRLKSERTRQKTRGDRKGESNDSPEIPDRRKPSDIPGLLFKKRGGCNVIHKRLQQRRTENTPPPLPSSKTHTGTTPWRIKRKPKGSWITKPWHPIKMDSPNTQSPRRRHQLQGPGNGNQRTSNKQVNTKTAKRRTSQTMQHCNAGE